MPANDLPVDLTTDAYEVKIEWDFEDQDQLGSGRSFIESWVSFTVQDSEHGAVRGRNSTFRLIEFRQKYYQVYEY